MSLKNRYQFIKKFIKKQKEVDIEYSVYKRNKKKLLLLNSFNTLKNIDYNTNKGHFFCICFVYYSKILFNR